jgi:PEP-CTERM motif
MPRRIQYCRAAALAAALMAGALTEAQATTITLDLSTLGAGTFSTAQNVDGFTLTPMLGNSTDPAIINDGGTYVLGATLRTGQADGADTILTMMGGGTFTLVSVTVAAMNGDTSHFGDYFVVVGNSSTLVSFGDNGTPLTTTLTTYDFSSAYQNITSVDLNPVNGGDGDVIGSITVSYGPSTAAPEPASLGLLGLGFVGVMRARRKSRK